MDVGCLILFSPQSCEAVRQFFYQIILSYKLINSRGVQFLFRTSESVHFVWEKCSGIILIIIKVSKINKCTLSLINGF